MDQQIQRARIFKLEDEIKKLRARINRLEYLLDEALANTVEMGDLALGHPIMGDRSTCKICHRPIEYVGPHWRHAIGGKGQEYRHGAIPEETSEAEETTKTKEEN